MDAAIGQARDLSDLMQGLTSGNGRPESADETVYSAALSHFDKLITAIGGAPETLREALKIESPATFDHSHALQYAHLVKVLHGASRYLARIIHERSCFWLANVA